MVIQHNMSAMNATRQLGMVTGSLARSTEKLSSGYKINRAADDAAGLSISEKMRKQIRGLDQASENIEDGISLCQVADGALNETVAILQRMRELAVQSANGTNSAGDRRSIEMEITQLKSEVDRIAGTTKFNDAVYPLNASVTESVVAPVIDYETTNTSSIALYEQTVTGVVHNLSSGGMFDDKYYAAGDTVSITGITVNGYDYIAVDGFPMGLAFPINGWIYDPVGTSTYSLKKSDLKIDEDGHIYYDSKSSGDKKYIIYTETTEGWRIATPVSSIASHYVNELGWLYLTVENLQSSQKTAVNQYVALYDSTSIHAGASSSQTNKIPIRIVNATCKGLGIADLSAVTEDSSTEAMELLDTALSRASKYRSAFGAAQNRLEHAEKIDKNTAENTQAAESQIRDTDMAVEMVRYSNANILSQAGQSMLAQANQSRQSVLSLIT